MKKVLLALLVMVVTAFAVSAKPAYKFTLTIKNCKDSVMLLGYYRAENVYVFDTAWLDKKGRFVFEGDRDLQPGLYYFTTPQGRFVNFVVYHEKLNFQFFTDDAEWTKNMIVKGSRENELFFSYHNRSAVLYEQLSDARRELDSVALIGFEQKQHDRYDSLQISMVEQYPKAMVSQMIKAAWNVEVPLVDDKGDTLSSNQRWEWLMAHYFDNIPLDDDFIIHTPKSVFYDRVMDYTDKYMRGLPPDMICPLLDSMIDRSEPAPEVYRWMVHTMTEKYLQSNVMVYDEVFVHLALRYYGSGKATWASTKTIDEVVERATKWERLLVGKEAPELIMFDTIRRAISLHHMPGKYTLLVFWSPTCGHCRDIIPAMYQVFEEYSNKIDMAAYSVLTDTDEPTFHKWQKFLTEHNMTSPRWMSLKGGEANVDWHEVYDVTSTPQIYLIENEGHTIVAKKFGADLFRTICENLEKKEMNKTIK